MLKKLPKISIITPSYNQANYIERTILSVLSQNYPNVEYIVMDGGSNDGTINILNKYQKRLKWFSKKDKGQSNALNNGFKIASGEIFAYINSDDYYETGAFKTVSEFFQRNRDAKWVTGNCRIVDSMGSEVRNLIKVYKKLFLKYIRYYPLYYIVQFIPQPSTFWKREVMQDIGYFDESLNYDMDYDFWLRVWKKYKLSYIDHNLASYRIHDRAKAVLSPETQFKIEYEIAKRHTDSKILLLMHQFHFRIALFFYRLFFIKK